MEKKHILILMVAAVIVLTAFVFPFVYNGGSGLNNGFKPDEHGNNPGPAIGTIFQDYNLWLQFNVGFCPHGNDFFGIG